MSILKSSKTTKVVILAISTILALSAYSDLPVSIYEEHGMFPIMASFLLVVVFNVVILHMVRIVFKAIYAMCGGKV